MLFLVAPAFLKYKFSNYITTSVGAAAMLRFARPVCYQGFPQALLPGELKDGNPLGIWRRINGQIQKDSR